MVDPARGIATVAAVNHTLTIDLEEEGMVGVGWVMRVALLALFPRNDLTLVFDDGLALCDVLQRKYPFAVHARAAHLDASAGGKTRDIARHGEISAKLNISTRVRRRARARQCIVEASALVGRRHHE